LQAILGKYVIYGEQIDDEHGTFVVGKIKHIDGDLVLLEACKNPLTPEREDELYDHTFLVSLSGMSDRPYHVQIFDNLAKVAAYLETSAMLGEDVSNRPPSRAN
jgi:hypothetical protein